ncbi:MAG TPA: hypothetical protein VGF71_05500 [Caulobacteraceae bacterium]
MTTTYTQTSAERSAAVEAGGAATESMGGVAVVILAILSLAGVVPGALTPIAAIVFGAAFLIEGAALAARRNEMMTGLIGAEAESVILGGGVTVEMASGVTAVVLGILALIGVASASMISTVLIVGGAGLILSAGALSEFAELRAALAGAAGATQRLARTAVSGAVGTQVLAGLSTVVLGILSLVPSLAAHDVTFVRVGMLVLGAALVVSGTALSGRMLGFSRRRR